MTRKLENFIIGKAGYFREREDDSFPWASTGKGIWFAIFVLEDGEIQRYGFTASMANKAGLLKALRSLTSEDEAVLLGVWHGEYGTDLFVLDIVAAIEKLEGLLQAEGS